MYLLDINSLQLEYTIDETRKPYCVLSHVWEKDQELVYQDIDNLPHSGKSGAEKIRSFCKLMCDKPSIVYDLFKSEEQPVGHVWVDTCCIDKKSSAELSEAINAMYLYYSTAKLCVAYLYDVEVVSGCDGFKDQFDKSKWFKRCWTLQELLAPSNVIFYNKYWQMIGNKHELAPHISEITRIDIAALRGAPISGYSIAQRMSWAAGREATRREDVAYSLMGLFDVNMPMLYGEGDNAFKRLQEAILGDSDDETLFAWAYEQKDPHEHAGQIGLFAKSPDYFRGCQDIVPTTLYKRNTTFSSTNRGLSGDMAMVGPLVRAENAECVALLNATRRTTSTENFIGIFLAPRDTNQQEWSRVIWEGSSRLERSLLHISKLGEARFEHIRVRHKQKTGVPTPTTLSGFGLASGIRGISSRRLHRHSIFLAEFVHWQTNSDNLAAEKNCLLSTRRVPIGPVCVIDCSGTSFETIQLIQLGFDNENCPVCIALDNPEQQTYRNSSIATPQISADDLRSFNATIYDRVKWTVFDDPSPNQSATAPTMRTLSVEQSYPGYLAIKGSRHLASRWVCPIQQAKKGFRKKQKSLVLTLIPKQHNLGMIFVFDAYVVDL